MDPGLECIRLLIRLSKAQPEFFRKQNYQNPHCLWLIARCKRELIFEEVLKEIFFQKQSGQILPSGPLRGAFPPGCATRWLVDLFGTTPFLGGVFCRQRAKQIFPFVRLEFSPETVS